MSFLRAKAPVINPGASIVWGWARQVAQGAQKHLTEQTYWVLGVASEETGEAGEGEEGVARSWRARAPNKKIWTGHHHSVTQRDLCSE